MVKGIRFGFVESGIPDETYVKIAPTITKGPYAGEIVTGDHIIPRSVCPELDNKIYNLEMMPLTLNQRKGAKVTQRQIDLAKRWNADGLLSDEGLGAVLD
ncbi:hypothetical protein N9139_00685 [Akkermansiaceae bacterium]|nr:hypothetical protein [Akkermansiaceae bacterium]